MKTRIRLQKGEGWARRGLAASLVRLGVLVAFAVTFTTLAEAQTYQILHSFTCTDGSAPAAGLILADAGNLYGTTQSGGTYNLGTVFEITPDGTESVLHSFAGAPTDGMQPNGGLIGDAEGNLYGTTFYGGVNNQGTVFEVAPDGSETLLYSFAGYPDGANPAASLIRDSAGNLYGTTYGGGKNQTGTVFKLTPAGEEGPLFTFANAQEGGLGLNSTGSLPTSGLVRDAAGNFYGTTGFGGPLGGGVVFKLNRHGKETVLHAFPASAADGGEPVAGLLRDAAGNLYSTNVGGGPYFFGDVFKLDSSNTETVLFNFGFAQQAGVRSTGANPEAGVVMDAKGNLYGTTAHGGLAHDFGLVYKLTPSGQETVLHDFVGSGPGRPFSDGEYPLAGLVFDSAGNLYGTTQDGGANNCGTVFKLTP